MILVAMDVSSLYTNIPQEEGIEIVCKAYETFHNNDPPIPTHYLRELLGVILTENSFEFIEKNYLQTHGVAMGTKTEVSFANIFMAEIETNLMQQNNIKPREWKRYIDDVFYLWDCNRNEVERFIEQANTFHPTKFAAKISENEIIFLDTVVFKGHYHLRAQHIWGLKKVHVSFPLCNMKICCGRRWLYAQQTISTCNATLLRNKLHEKCCPY